MSRYSTNKAFFETFRITVAAAGTARKLPDIAIPDGFQLIVKADDANTGNMEIGPTQAIAQSTDAFVLDAGQSIGLKIQNCNQCWVDATVNGESVFCYVERY